MTDESERPEIKFGDAVLVIGSGKQYSGRIGMAAHYFSNDSWEIQFGADGPFARIRTKYLRHALLREIEAAGMYGVGFNIIDEDFA